MDRISDCSEADSFGESKDSFPFWNSSVQSHCQGNLVDHVAGVFSDNRGTHNFISSFSNVSTHKSVCLTINDRPVHVSELDRIGINLDAFAGGFLSRQSHMRKFW